ncbi:thiol-disulfide isomerase [Pseudoalteromonas porphyrae]|uniref:Thiol-disulfide isomerase n=2 Tax=Pseudoalteromonas TaxID=53246 RepID=A0A0N0M1S8_9GAMM|nr:MULTISPECIES: glutaredoxin family protein [Pseudoalteromonas]KPH64979.1 thiol-disulfide isomerase [Pseudoalteromonas porphyrae]KPH95071.1 thiol-disulfide isomerase [Pseudoalteromonas porphyrae]NNG43795.1 glutaredoxin family protein [Pseudoalteromonas sp. NEC-BIFX-2020_002]
MAKWILYHTDGCHLCEQAHALLTPLLDDDSLQLIDIMSDETLISKYQTSIPVLESERGQQFFWPFTAQDVRQFFTQTE